ncbi:MAG TPA: protein kinase [Gemmatimonadales bacterium]|nr:protein kinase [Gemmatimonadales bacterium]
MADETLTQTGARLGAALAGRYRIERELGQGGMATVYLAQDLRHDRRVALKVLRAELAAVIGAERFLAEIKTTANLQHPHILPLFDSGTADAFLYYVMPFVEGESLRDRLTRETQLPVDEAVRIATEVAGALDYAHRHGVVHRDIKPENILLAEGQALVADFGIALAVSRSEGATRMTETGMSLGTPHYMSPEQAMGEREITPKADVYALGCVLYEMLLGEPPFTGPTAQAVVAKVMTEKPAPIVPRRERVPAHVEDAVLTALEKLPADRFPTAAAFAEALHRPDAATPRRADAPTRAAPAAWVLGAGGAGLAAAGFLLAVLVLHRSGPPIARFGRATKVTYDRGLEVYPALSPDGRSVAYAAGSSIALKIFVRQVAGGRAIPLTGDTSDVEWEPYWSADGTRILFLARGGVWSAPSSGGETQPEIPAPAGGSVTSAEWSPDGKSIAYIVGDTLLLWAGQRRERQIALLHDPALCRWSPNGELIACASGNRFYLTPGIVMTNLSPSRIVVVRVRDGAVHTVTDSTSLNQSPVWSRDGRWLYDVSDRDGPRDVFAVPIGSDGRAAGRAVRLTTGLGAQTISLSADGRRLAYAAFTGTSNIWSLPLPAHPPAPAAGLQQLTSGDQVIEEPYVTRDGKWLTYHSDLTGRGQLYRIALPHGASERMTSDTFDDYAPSLSPDGREVAFHSWRTGSRDIYVLPLDGGPVQQVTNTPRQEAVAHWSPDGRALVFGDLIAPGGIWIARRRADRSWATAILRRPTGYWPDFSPDGRWLVFTHELNGGAIGILAVDSGPERILVDPERAGILAEVPQYSADGTTVYFKSHDARGVASIWEVPAAGGTPRLLARLDDPAHTSYRPELAVGAGRMYFTVEDRQADVYVMDVERR